MPALPNPRHEAFCQASGNASAAYRDSGGNGKNADDMADQLMVTNGIAERIAELKAEADAKAEFTRANMLAFLAKVIRTESGQMRDRLRAVELLAKMCGWSEPRISAGFDLRAVGGRCAEPSCSVITSPTQQASGGDLDGATRLSELTTGRISDWVISALWRNLNVNKKHGA